MGWLLGTPCAPPQGALPRQGRWSSLCELPSLNATPGCFSGQELTFEFLFGKILEAGKFQGSSVPVKPPGRPVGWNHTPHLVLGLQEPPAQAWSPALPAERQPAWPGPGPSPSPSRPASRHQLVDTRPR